MAKVVWILGAGFSRPLGGPLLKELFSPGSALRVHAAFPASKYGKVRGSAVDVVRGLYRIHRVDSDEHGREMWIDAEDYLDYLDTAAAATDPGNPARKALTELLSDGRLRQGVSIEEAASTARRLLAAECSAFLVAAEADTEKWGPYRRWAELLQDGDVVITFNYDLLTEKLGRQLPEQNKLRVLFPSLTPRGPTRLHIDYAYVSLIKLHGSVNWFREDHGSGVVQVVAHPDDYCALDCPDDKVVIASPGPTKQKITTDLLLPLWQAARSAIGNADGIVFVGYRFPPTDSAARRFLVQAVGANRKDLLLHTVLGPDTHNSDTERLRSILEVAMSREGRRQVASSVKAWPLFAQDFLDLYEREQLTR